VNFVLFALRTMIIEGAMLYLLYYIALTTAGWLAKNNFRVRSLLKLFPNFKSYFSFEGYVC
jgi:hypothetical protein